MNNNLLNETFKKHLNLLHKRINENEEVQSQNENTNDIFFNPEKFGLSEDVVNEGFKPGIDISAYKKELQVFLKKLYDAAENIENGKEQESMENALEKVPLFKILIKKGWATIRAYGETETHDKREILEKLENLKKKKEFSPLTYGEAGTIDDDYEDEVKRLAKILDGRRTASDSTCKLILRKQKDSFFGEDGSIEIRLYEKSFLGNALTRLISLGFAGLKDSISLYNGEGSLAGVKSLEELGKRLVDRINQKGGEVKGFDNKYGDFNTAKAFRGVKV